MSKAPRLAVLGVVLLGALALTSWQAGWFGSGKRPRAKPLLVGEVPSSLPPGGVSVDGMVLTPWASTPSRAMSAEQAIARARHFANAHPFPARALEADLTEPGASDPKGPLKHRPVWVVTFTARKPVDVGTVSSIYVKHFSVALNATTGAFVRGFFTR